MNIKTVLFLPSTLIDNLINKGMVKYYYENLKLLETVNSSFRVSFLSHCSLYHRNRERFSVHYPFSRVKTCGNCFDKTRVFVSFQIAACFSCAVTSS